MLQWAGSCRFPVHLVNTFLLLASLALTAWWASGGDPIEFKGYGIILWAFAIGYVGFLILGVSGAITALGDTLFPVGNIWPKACRQDLNPAAHFLVRLRVWHPVIAVLVGFYTIFVVSLVGMFRTTIRIKRLVIFVVVLFVAQLAAGLVNLVLLAPVWMQIVHLLLADLVWIGLVLVTAANFANSELMQASAPITQPVPGRE